MKVENILDAIGLINDKAVQDARAYRRTNYSKTFKWGALIACICAIVMAAIPIMQNSNYVADNEPQRELTVTEAISSEPFGSLYPETILDGYVLENNTVALYDGTVMKAVYCNDNIGDVLTITIAAKEYFGDVERNTILQYKQSGTRIYLENGEYMIAYYFSTRDIAKIENFEQMVTSATSFNHIDDQIPIPVQRPIAAYIQDDVSSVEVSHYYSNKVSTWTVEGEELAILREWTNALQYEIKDFENKDTPDKAEDSELFSISISGGDYPGFSYIIDSSGIHYLLIEGYWYSVTNPSYPPLTDKQ
ncbi:MAG: hypothetical protein HFH85_17755 [Lachnospiraceae bacterium]|jgi:hypothetical protein|nr:hypothetical protein [Lachnospiraceae bacterium]HBA46200.1 hypothetical protein [Lachnospiraceae bacterium]